MIETRVRGTVDARFEPVREAFVENFEKHSENGAACCVYLEGRPVVDGARADRAEHPSRYRLANEGRAAGSLAARSASTAPCA